MCVGLEILFGGRPQEFKKKQSLKNFRIAKIDRLLKRGWDGGCKRGREIKIYLNMFSMFQIIIVSHTFLLSSFDVAKSHC